MMEPISMINRSDKIPRQIMGWIIALMICVFFIARSMDSMCFLIGWSVNLTLLILMPIIVFTYTRPYKVVMDADALRLVSVFREKSIPVKAFKEVYDWERKSNTRGARVLYYADKRYDMHWLSPEIQDRIISEYRIPVKKKDQGDRIRP